MLVLNTTVAESGFAAAAATAALSEEHMVFSLVYMLDPLDHACAVRLIYWFFVFD